MLTDLQNALRSHLEQIRNFMAPKWLESPRLSKYHYRGMQDFVLREGQFFEPKPLPTSIQCRTPTECFLNAFLMNLERDLPYVEGYALLSGNGDFPHLHAWNLDAEGFVIDTTWNPVGKAYLGVIFPFEALLRRFEGGESGSLIDDWRHGFPLLRKPWNPQDVTK